jgi:hypothetical protein
MHLDTVPLREKIIKKLDEIFDIATKNSNSRSKITDFGGEKRRLSVAEKQGWARIAAYTAQIMDNVAHGMDERQIDEDLDRLKRLLHEVTTNSNAK